MLGAILGDIIGSYYEYRPTKRKDFQLFHEGCGITDDTILTLAVADTLLRDADPAATLKSWVLKDYKLVGGYGQRFIQWVFNESSKPYGSLGNGGAMRVSPAAWIARSELEVPSLVERVTAVTHDHPEGLKWAHATARAIWLARSGNSAGDLRKALELEFGIPFTLTVDDIRPGYRHTEKSGESVPQAIICALEASSFEDAIRNAVSLGGDADTQACIAGSIAEALFGIPQNLQDQAISFLNEDMLDVLHRFRSRISIETHLHAPK